MTDPKELREWAENACEHLQLDNRTTKPRGLCCVALEAADEWERMAVKLVLLYKAGMTTKTGVEIIDRAYDDSCSLLEDAQKWRYAIQSCEADFEEKITRIGARGFVIFQKDRVQMDKDKEDARKWRELKDTGHPNICCHECVADGLERDRYREALESARKRGRNQWEKWGDEAVAVVEIIDKALAQEKP